MLLYNAKGETGFTAKRSARARLLAATLLATICAPISHAQDRHAAVRDLLEKRQFDQAVEALDAIQQSGDATSQTYLLLAKAYMETGAGIAAEAAVERARRLGADYARTAVPFAKAKLIQGKFADALGALRGVSIPPEMQVEATVIAGDAQFALKRFGEARRNYELARKTDAQNYQAYLGLARLELEEGNLGAAGELAAKAHDLAPSNTMVRYTQGLIARYHGDAAAAEEYFMEAQQLFAGNVLANIELAAIRIDQNRLNEAQAFLDRIYEVAPQNPMAKYLSGTILAGQGRYEEAATLLNSARVVTENYLPAVYIRGLVGYQLGNFAIAEELLGKVLRAKPGNLPARLALASTYIKQKKPQAATNILKPAMLTQPDNPNVLAVAAAAAMARGDTEEGQAIYEKLAALTGGEAPVSRIDAKVALAKFVAGDREEALSSLSSAIASREADVRSLAILGEMQLRERDYDGAEDTILKLLSIAPDRALGYNMKGSLEYTQQKFEQALRSFSEAVSRNGEYYTAIRNRALTQIRLGRLTEAERDLKRLLELTPSDARAKAMLGRVLLRANKPAEAVDYFNDAVRAIPNSVDIWADYSEALAGAGKTADAISQAKDTAVMAADRPDLLKRMGVLLLGLGEARVAVRPLSRFVAYNPDSGAAHLLHARAMLSMGLYTGAKTSFERARLAEKDQPDPDQLNWYLFAADALAGRYDTAMALRGRLLPGKRPADVSAGVVGDLLLGEGKPAEAEQAYRDALAIERTASIVIGLSRAQQAQGKTADAIRTLERYVADNPVNRPVRLRLGRQYANTGRNTDAIKQYEAILRGGVADAEVAALLALAYMIEGDAKSIPLVEKAYLIRPEDPFILDTYGWIKLQAQRDTGTAISVLEQASRRAPSVALYRFHLGMAYLARGRRNEARQAFADALSLDANFSEAREAERQLRLLD